jgi:hypothetical protein
VRVTKCGQTVDGKSARAPVKQSHGTYKKHPPFLSAELFPASTKLGSRIKDFKKEKYFKKTCVYIYTYVIVESV